VFLLGHKIQKLSKKIISGVAYCLLHSLHSTNNNDNRAWPISALDTKFNAVHIKKNFIHKNGCAKRTMFFKSHPLISGSQFTTLTHMCGPYTNTHTQNFLFLLFYSSLANIFKILEQSQHTR
jgi:hypothetical protein